MMNLTAETNQTLACLALHDRIVGTIIASALGDAIGLYTEFLSAKQSQEAYPPRKFTLLPPSQVVPFRRDPHRNPHHPGEWTDDTDHALLILLGFLHSDGKEKSPKELAERLVIWVQFGLLPLETLPLGLGATVGRIVRSGTYLENPEARARQHWKNTKYHVAPNGSLMRTHPVGLMCLDETAEDTFRIAAEYSCVTHVDPRCLVSCAIGSALIRGLVRGEVKREEDVDEMIDLALRWWRVHREQTMKEFPERNDEPDLDVDELRSYSTVGSLEDLKLDEPAKIGYVYKTFGSGIHLLRTAMRKIKTHDTMATRTKIFEPLITELTMQGGDADTNACFAGAVLGAYLGFAALPAHWRDGLIHGDWLMEKAESLSIVMGAKEGTYSGQEDKDTARDAGKGYPTRHEMDGRAARLMARMATEETEAKRREAKKDKNWLSWMK